MADTTLTTTPATGSGGTSSLLVVDDNDLDRQFMAERLAKLGYDVWVAGGGAQAIELLERQPADLILLDSIMPGMSGIQALRALKSHKKLREIPVIMISGLDDIESVVKCIRVGAEDYVSSPFDPVLLAARIDASLEARRLRAQEARFMEQIQKEKQLSEQLVNVVIPIGISFMEERDLNRLLEQILLEAKKMTRADGGTIYLLAEGRRLNFMILRNDSLSTAMGGTTGKPIPFPPLELYHPQTGAPNHAQIACHVALSGESVNIPDAYNAEGFDFHGTRAFDQKTGYRSTSFLTVPLKNKSKKVIGVLQLINALDAQTRRVIPFDQTVQHGIESLSLLAASALELNAKAAAAPLAPAVVAAGGAPPPPRPIPPPPRPFGK